MAKRFACSDIGMSCGFVASARDENVLVGKIAGRAKKEHGMYSIDSAIMKNVRAAIMEA